MRNDTMNRRSRRFISLLLVIGLSLCSTMELRVASQQSPCAATRHVGARQTSCLSHKHTSPNHQSTSFVPHPFIPLLRLLPTSSHLLFPRPHPPPPYPLHLPPPINTHTPR